MTTKQRIGQDLKTALLAGDGTRVSVLRSLKSVILYAEVAKGVKASGEDLPEGEILLVIAKESKKHQESADSYAQANREDRANQELAEKEIIDSYLPKPLDHEGVFRLIDEVAASVGGLSQPTMGRVISEVKQRAGAAAEGALIAQLVKDRLSQ